MNPRPLIVSGEIVFASRSRKDANYHVVIENGRATCTCLGFYFRRHCAHVELLQAEESHVR